MAPASDLEVPAGPPPAPPRERIDADAPLTDLLRLALGAEVSMFGPAGNQLGPSCSACCGCEVGGGKVTGERGCAPVRRLLAGEALDPAQVPPLCESGHCVALQQMEASNHVLVLRRRDALPGQAAQDERLIAIAALWERCERLASESQGLAQEVIRSYEQLNVIFDITQEICKARDAGWIKHFIIRRVARSLSCDWACCLSPSEGVLWWSATDDGSKDSSRDATVAYLRNNHAARIEEVSRQRSALVYNASSNADSREPSLLFATLGEASGELNVLVFARPSQTDFVYGDVMTIDAVLNHGQHVITNLRMVERLRAMSLGAVRALVSAIDKKDRYTSGHSERVGFLARLVGEKLGLAPDQLQDLEWGGLLHDVGKIGVQDGVLGKPGSLTSEEFDHVKQHVRMSYEIVAPIECLASVRDVVLYHHETPDGTGYPMGLKGEEIPLLARIVHVADTFDALTTSRSYRKAFPLAQAIAIMNKDKGPKLDVGLVDCFIVGFNEFRAQQPDRFRQLFAHLEEEQPA